MITNPYCTRISLPTILVNDEILYRSEDTPYKVSDSDINPEIIEILWSKRIAIASVEIFKTGKSNRRWVIHTDGYSDWFEGQLYGDMAKINWVYGNLNCDMKWYREHQNITTETRYNKVGPYVVYNDHDVDEVFSMNIGECAIVQSGIPHTVINNSDVDRYSVSLHLNCVNFPRAPYPLITHLLQEFIIQ